MKKLFFVFLLLVCSAAQAEWQLVVTSLDKTRMYYVDATTIQKNFIFNINFDFYFLSFKLKIK